jgi:hypothetical protein
MVTVPGTEGVRRLVLGEWRFTTSQGETSERLHCTVLDMLLRSYGKQLLWSRRSRLPRLAQSVVELCFEPIARDATALPIDVLVSRLSGKVPANPLDRDFPDLLELLSISEPPVIEKCDLAQVFSQVSAARQRHDHAGASRILSMMLDSWRDEYPTDRRVVALAMLLFETAQRGQPLSVACGDQLLTDMRALEKESPFAALAAIRHITTEIDGLPVSPERTRLRRALRPVLRRLEAGFGHVDQDEEPPF